MPMLEDTYTLNMHTFSHESSLKDRVSCTHANTQGHLDQRSVKDCLKTVGREIIQGLLAGLVAERSFKDCQQDRLSCARANDLGCLRSESAYPLA